MEAKDHQSKRDADLSSQVVLQSAHCADVKLFLFLKQPVLWFQSTQRWSQPAKSW